MPETNNLILQEEDQDHHEVQQNSDVTEKSRSFLGRMWDRLKPTPRPELSRQEKKEAALSILLLDANILAVLLILNPTLGAVAATSLGVSLLSVKGIGMAMTALSSGLAYFQMRRTQHATTR